MKFLNQLAVQPKSKFVNFSLVTPESNVTVDERLDAVEDLELAAAKEAKAALDDAGSAKESSEVAENTKDQLLEHSMRIAGLSPDTDNLTEGQEARASKNKPAKKARAGIESPDAGTLELDEEVDTAFVEINTDTDNQVGAANAEKETFGGNVKTEIDQITADAVADANIAVSGVDEKGPTQSQMS